MPSVFFEQFEELWRRVGEKFASESDLPFTPENLRDLLISRGLINHLTKFDPINEKFLNHRDKPEKPPSVNLSPKIFDVLDQYAGQENRGVSLEDFKEIIEKNVREKEAASALKEINLAEISFLGREAELVELEDFLKLPEKRIFALYGVPMIGKTKLVNHFLENNELAKTYRVITVKLNPRPDDAERTIKDELFGDRAFNDFSDFTSNTIIVIQNFEETLKWTGNPRELHDLKDEYKNIKTFLEEATKNDAVKLILESRFQIHFELFLNDWKAKVKTLPNVQLEGIERDKFWEFYKSNGFSFEQFEKLCENFGNHPGLLALAFNDVEYLYQNKLIEALYELTVTTELLWDLIERIIDRLEKREKWILCALTFLKKPVKKEDLYEDFSKLPDFEDGLQIGNSFNSLTNKLLVQRDRGLYDLNPYIREVCYTFLKGRHKKQMIEIENLPYFKEFGETPYYDEIQQAQERGNFATFFRWVKDNRQKRNFKEVHSHLEGAKLNPLFKEVIVLNEIAITYKTERKFDKAIEVLEEAIKKYPNDVKILNELGICYRENKQLDKAIEILEKAAEKYPDNVKILNGLGICYRENKQFIKSIEILEKAGRKFPDEVKNLNELGISYRENKQLDKAIEILEKAAEKYPDDAKLLNELGICYRENKQLDKAIETLEKAAELGNIHSYNELGISYRENKQFDKAIETLEKAAELGNVHSYTALITTYKEIGDLEKAYEVAQSGVKASDWKDALLVKQLRELESLIRQKRNRKLKVFLSYSHKDKDIKDELIDHLSALKRSEKISTWNDRELPVGAEWDKTIKAELENADIVLLLISANFIASNYIWDIEIKKAIEKDENKTAVVIPIFCKPCDFDDMPFAKLQGLPRDVRFIASQPDRDQAYMEVAKGIREVVENWGR